MHVGNNPLVLVEFASNDEKHPLLICGDEAAKILRATKLKGLELVKVKE